MKLSKVEIKNFRRVEHAEINLSPASFIIGPNNYGKSSILRAIDALLSLKEDVIKPDDFRLLPDGNRCQTIEICGWFSDIDPETANSRGFKGRVINGQFFYKKTYTLSNTTKPVIETFLYPYQIVEPFDKVKTYTDLLGVGLTEEQIQESLGVKKVENKKLPNEWEFKIEGAIEWDMEAEPQLFKNPGGAPSNVNSKLPRLLYIPSYANSDDVGKADSNKTLLGECLGYIFEDILADNQLAKDIQENLNELQKQMSPDTDESLIKVLCSEVNNIIGDVFPNCGIHINPSLQGLTEILKPKYSVEMYSNVNTDATRQGTGLIRTAIFSMLKYHAKLKAKKETRTKPLIIAFEEPEIYLHPSAANMLRDTIYSLGLSNQIISTTHSPWMIDLSKEWQSLTKVYLNKNGFMSTINYGVSEALKNLEEDEKQHVKMIKTFDDELSRVFFAEKCLIVEGDSEQIAIKNTLNLLPEDVQKEIKSTFQITKARGKAAIISLVKYLQALSINPIVMHDLDSQTEGAAKMNKHIEAAVGDTSRVFPLQDCLEDCLNYKVPTSDKPYRAFVETSKWASWDDVPPVWAAIIRSIFEINALEVS
ncbi:ATP-dependent endonuclease of the OLD family-like protein [Desulforamulus reducens MI-1]|uniref:ATP-dependent endonuclease of the OLD family-like protein n=1 Tax=Desulforamulus reducens (strain ATCC BAA-1160 / DSM 100696 / MI-1) TaxID=349161 RepID=A4J2V4_DESRM|nr:AAA family ATPase [Desulforamulus reducens]ABO49407.1 ATP-dependent endonuclease of the OLD family-like protein [Desulforamulus reducens MI-1]